MCSHLEACSSLMEGLGIMAELVDHWYLYTVFCLFGGPGTSITRRNEMCTSTYRITYISSV